MTHGKKDKAKAPQSLQASTTEAPEISPEIDGNAAGVQVMDAEPVAGFPIVGIGASAGGLAAFEAFFSGMPPVIDPGMAFVLVQHLAPDHKSILADLIRRYTRMQVFEVEDGMTVQPNCAYIIPPNRDMAFLNGTLQLMEPSAPRGQRLPIDFFLRSLAQDQRERAICIVLSGTGSDGTLGVRAIKGEGGMVMVQNPESTEYDGMPRSAIATGMVDYELPPAEMPAQLMAYVAHAFGKTPKIASPTPPRADNALKKILILLRSQTSHDFSQYKPSTVHRRIERRMAVQQISGMDEYVRYLQQTPPEVEALFRDLLIGVTKFFRDPEIFKVIEEQAIPKLFSGKSADTAIRVWTPGCSTGEEAYSIAILLAERQESMKQGYMVQVFATDIDSNAISAARAGIYPASIATDVSPERLARFFTVDPDGGNYRIHKSIRDMLVFSEQNVIKDPPFSKVDLISCRNLLIYLDGVLQKKLIPLFHYALSPGGFLFLGSSETIGDFSDLFTVQDRKAKLYQRKEKLHGLSHTTLSWFLPPMTAVDGVLPRTVANMAFPGKLSLRELAEQALLQQVAPAGALVTSQGDILYLHGRTGMFLELATGEPGICNILKMAREGLRPSLASALHKTARVKEIVRCPGLRVKTNGDFTSVNLTVRPVAPGPVAPLDVPPLYLVTLEEAPLPDRVSDPSSENSDPSADADVRIAALKQELRIKGEYLQTSHEELETSNEELKSSNEEMQSVNEELQSTNEELETSKEELQSVNEELSTVNNELQTKVADLSRVNNDMNNLLAGTGIGTVFVDRRLRILRFTPTASAIINLILSDVGRPVGHIVSNLIGYDRMVADVQDVLDTLIPKELEVQAADNKWYTLRIQPYRTVDNIIEGAVITFVDITTMKQTEAALRESEEKFCAIANYTVAWEIWFDADGKILWMNPAVERITGYSVAEVYAMPDFISILIDEQDRDVFTATFQDALRGGKGDNLEFRCVHKNGSKFWLGQSWQPIFDTKGNSLGVRASSHDITQRKLAEESLRKANDLLRLAVVVRDALDAVTLQDLEGRILAWNPAAVRMYGWSEAEALAMNVRDRVPEGQRENALDHIRRLGRAEILKSYRTQRITKEGTVVDVRITATALVNEAGQMVAIATTERVLKSKKGRAKEKGNG
jgi:two-component system CheB/CheR fusion protein